jgi:hypothetical protein
MLIKEMCLSFVQFELLAEPLRPFAPAIPFDFLLDSGKYATMFGRCLQRVGQCRAPWSTGYGRRFWRSYIERESPPPREYWDHLVPFKHDSEPALKASWLKGNARARAYLYPWGVGVLIDMNVTEAKDIDAAVDMVVSIRNSNHLEMTLKGGARIGTVQFLVNSWSKYVREVAFGPETEEGSRSDLFMIVTVLDADGADPNAAVGDGTPLHRSLNGFARGIKNWKTAVPGPIGKSALGTGSAAAGNILFATKRGRTVWYPDSFPSVGSGFEDTLRCYHRNLTAATLQTEALCMFASDAAALISAGKTHAEWASNHDQCGLRAAGLLGRLIGGKKGTYRSQSPQNQIETLYDDSVKSLRGEYFGP